MSFSFDKYDLCKKGPLFNKVIFRTISIFVLGLIINAFPFVRQDWDWSSFRILGVLQRIALAYFIAAFIIIRSNIKGLVQISFTILAGYWLLLYMFGYINGVDPYSLSSNLALAIDKIILGEIDIPISKRRNKIMLGKTYIEKVLQKSIHNVNKDKYR